MEKHTRQIKDESTQNYLDQIHFLPVDSDPDEVFEKVRYRIRYGNPKMVGVSPVWKYFAVAASIALLLVSSLFILTPMKNMKSVAYMEVKAIPGSKTRVVLPDSTEVWLNSNASIRYPQQFTDQNREVKFSGEALFTVTKNKKKPFVIDMDGMKIQVLGTVFNIHSAEGSDIIETTLLEGSVAIYPGNTAAGQANLILSPNEQALYHKTSGEIDVQRVRASLYSAWVNGIFHFENNTLEEIMTTLSRAFDVSIHLESKSLGQKKFTAQFFHHETLDEILSILQISAKYKYKKVKGEVYISEK